MRYDYEDLLKRARSQIPQVVSKRERLELPTISLSVIGMRTIVYNFKEIAEALNRDPKHLLKFLTREARANQGFSKTESTKKKSFLSIFQYI